MLILRSTDFALTSVGADISIMRLTKDKSPRPSQFPITLNVPFKLQKISLGVQQLDQHCLTLSESTESDDQSVLRDTVSDRWTPSDPQIATDLERLIFQISNKISTGFICDDEELLASLVNRLKTVAKSSSRWRRLLSDGQGVTPRSLIEQLFIFSIRNGDKALADLMLRIGADANQKVEKYISALDYAVEFHLKSIVDLLLDSGALYGQITLMRAIVAENFDIADFMLQSNPLLSLNFNYCDDPDSGISSKFGALRVETVSLLGLMFWSCTGACLHGYHGEMIVVANVE